MDLRLKHHAKLIEQSKLVVNKFKQLRQEPLDLKKPNSISNVIRSCADYLEDVKAQTSELEAEIKKLESLIPK